MLDLDEFTCSRLVKEPTQAILASTVASKSSKQIVSKGTFMCLCCMCCADTQTAICACLASSICVSRLLVWIAVTQMQRTLWHSSVARERCIWQLGNVEGQHLSGGACKQYGMCVVGDMYWHVHQVDMSAAGEGRDNKSIDVMLVRMQTHNLIAVHIDGRQHLEEAQSQSDKLLDEKIQRCWRDRCSVVRLAQDDELIVGEGSWRQQLVDKHIIACKARM